MVVKTCRSKPYGEYVYAMAVWLVGVSLKNGKNLVFSCPPHVGLRHVSNKELHYPSFYFMQL